MLPGVSMFAQTWAPVGATWHYSELDAVTSEQNYVEFRVEKQTLFQGEMCSEITKWNDLFCYQRPSVEYTFERNDSVFMWEISIVDFQMIYDFSADTGDTWTIHFKNINLEPDSTIVTVDSTSNTTINGKVLRQLHVTYSNTSNAYPSIITEKLGDEFYMFYYHHHAVLVCDGNYTTGMRCYQDDSLGYYHHTNADSCTYISGIEEEKTSSIVDLYPNPTNNQVFVRNPIPSKTAQFLLFNQFGSLKASFDLKSGTDYQRLDLTNLTEGIYFYSVKFNLVSHTPSSYIGKIVLH